MGSPSVPRLLQVVPGGPCDKGRDSIVKPQDRLLSVDGVPVSAPGPQRTMCAARAVARAEFANGSPIVCILFMHVASCPNNTCPLRFRNFRELS
jgi:hypothetical protein